MQASSAASLVLDDGYLFSAAKDVEIAAGTSLELSGAGGYIKTPHLQMQDGSSLVFRLNESIPADEAYCVLEGALEQKGKLTVCLETDDVLENGSVQTLLFVGGNQSAVTWNDALVTVTGSTGGNLYWQDNALLFEVNYHPVTWSSGSTWSTSARSWVQNGSACAFENGMSVTFGDRGAGTISLSGALAPSSVVVENSAGHDYVWRSSGSGSLNGSMRLTKKGSGTLTLEMANAYTGGTRIAEGTVEVKHARALGSGSVTLSGGALSVAAAGVAADISAAGQSTLRVKNGIVFAPTTSIRNSGTLTLSGAFNASALTLNTTEATHVNTSGVYGENGFARTASYEVQLVQGGTVINQGASVTHGTLSLTLGEDGVARKGGVVDTTTYYLTSGDLSSATLHGVSALASVSLSGGTLTVTDATTVRATGGTIALKSGALSGSISGAEIQAAGGSLSASLSGNNRLVGQHYQPGAVFTNSGVLTLSGSFDASALPLISAYSTHVDTDGNQGSNGFVQVGESRVQLVKGGSTVNDGAAVTHGWLNLELGTDGMARCGVSTDFSSYLLQSGSVQSSAVHAQAPAAVLQQKGGQLLVDDSTEVISTGGSITLSAGVLSGSIDSGRIMAEGGSLSASLSGNTVLEGHGVSLTSALNNSGTLTLSGSFDVSDMALTSTLNTYLSASGTKGSNGFRSIGSSSLTVVKGGSVVNNGASFLFDGIAFELGDDGIARCAGETNYGTYFLKSGSVSSSAVHAVSADAVIRQTGGTLTLNDAATLQTTGGTISMTTGAVLNGTLDNAELTLSGGVVNAELRHSHITMSDTTQGRLQGTIADCTIDVTGGVIKSSFSGENSLNLHNYAILSVIENSGVLTLSGTLDVLTQRIFYDKDAEQSVTYDMPIESDILHEDVNGVLGENGYAHYSNRRMQLVSGGTVIADGLTVDDGYRLDEQGVLHLPDYTNSWEYFLYSGAVATSQIHRRNSNAEARVYGGTLTVDDKIILNAWGGYLICEPNGMLLGHVENAVVKAKGGYCAPSFSGENSLIGQDYVVRKSFDNSGTLTLSGTFDISALSLSQHDAAYTDVNGTHGENGFYMPAGTDALVVKGGRSVDDGAIFLHNGTEMRIGADGVARSGGGVDFSSYILRSDSVVSSAVHTISPEAHIALSGGTLTADDSVTVQATGGQIVLAGGTLSGSLQETALSARSGALSATLSGANTIQGEHYVLGSVLRNRGMLTLSGSFDASQLSLQSTGASLVDAGGTAGENGFTKSSSYSVRLVNGGSVINNGATVQHGSLNLQLGEDGVARLEGTTDYSCYTLNSGLSTTSSIHRTAQDATFVLNGGTLIVTDAATVRASGGELSLDGGSLSGQLSGVSLSASVGSVSAEFSGQNEIYASSWALFSPLQNSGTLTLNGSFDVSAMELTRRTDVCLGVDGEMASSGYRISSPVYELQLVQGGETLAQGATVRHGSTTLSVGRDGVARSAISSSKTVFFLAPQDTLSLQSVISSAPSTPVRMESAGTLAVDTSAKWNGHLLLMDGALRFSGETLNVDGWTMLEGDALQLDVSAYDRAGTYTLIHAVKMYLDALYDPITLTGTHKGRLNYALDATDTDLLLTVTGNPVTLTWAGGSGYWDNGKETGAWLLPSGVDSTDDTFRNGDAVVFSKRCNVYITEDVAPSSVLVDCPLSVILNGSGGISGAASLVKRGSGVLTIGSANHYTGGTVVEDGKINVDHNSALGSGDVELRGGTLVIRAAQMLNGLRASGASAIEVYSMMEYDLPAPIVNSGTLTLSGAFDVSALSASEQAATHVNLNGTFGEDGFARTAFCSVQVVQGGTTVNNGATITHQGRELALGSDGAASAGGIVDKSLYTLVTGGVSSSAVHRASAAASVALSGGMLTADDTVSVTATKGTLTLEGGRVTGSISGSSVIAREGSLDAELCGNNTLRGENYAVQRVLHNSGTLSMSGSFDLSALNMSSTAATYVDLTGASGRNGFEQTSERSIVVVQGGSVSVEGATFTRNGLSFTLSSDGVARNGGGIDKSCYYQTSGSLSSAALHRVSSGASVSLSGGTLAVDDTVVVSATSGSVTLSGGILQGSLSGVALMARNGSIQADLLDKSSLCVAGEVHLSGSTGLSLLELQSGTLHADLSTAGIGELVSKGGSLAGSLSLEGGLLTLGEAPLTVNGTLSLKAETRLGLDAYTAPGEYTLLTADVISGSVDHLSYTETIARRGYDVSLRDNEILLTVTALANDLTWILPKGTWSDKTTIGGVPMESGDNVIFRSAANVTISGEVQPGSVVVDSPDKVTFTSNKKVYGSGISGDASVTKDGAGLLTMNAGNTYTGGTTLNAGTLKATAVDSFGEGSITINGGTLDLGSKAVSNDIVLSGEATIKGDAKYVGNVTVEGDATLLAKASHKGMTSIGAGSTLTLAPKATMAGSITIEGGALDITAPKGMTLAKNMTMQLNGGSVSGLLTIGTGSTLVWQDGIFETSAPVLKGGTVDLGGWNALTLTGSKAQVQFGDKVIELPGKGIVRTDEELNVNSGTVTVNALDGYAGELVVNDGTLKLATGKATTENDIVVNGTAAVVNGSTHYGDIIVDGLLAKGTTIKLLDEHQKVALNGDGALLGTISGAGIVDVRGDVDITGAKLTNANILLGGTLTHAKGLTLAKGQTLTLDGGSVNGILTIGAGAVLDMNGHTLTAAPVLKGGTYDDGGSHTLTLTGAKADISLGEQQVSLLSKSFIKSDAVLTVNSGTVTVNDFGTSEQELTVTGGTLKLATGKQTSRNTIVVNGTAALVNGATHYGDIEVNGELAKGTSIKLLTADQRVVLKGGETLLGTISGAGIIDVNADINATAAKLTAATININSGCTFTNTKGIKLAKGQTLNLTGASLDLGTKGVLATVAGSTLGVSGNNTLTGSLTLGGGELVFSEGGTLTLDGTLTLSKPVTVTGSGSITYGTLKPFKGELSALFGGADVAQTGNTLLITGNAPTLRLAAAPLATASEAPAPLDAAPAIPVVNPVADAMVQADWGILDAERAFMGAVNSRNQHAALLDKGMGAAWVSAFGASVRHGNQGTHHGSDGTLSGAAFGLEHAVSDTGTLGLAVGRSKNRLAATGVTHLRQETAHVALYGQKQLKHGFAADAAATYGDTETKLGSVSWTQKSAALTARLTHATMLSDATAFRTFGGLTYEATDAGSLGTVHTGSVQNLRAELGAGATHTVGKAHFYAEAALTGDMVRHNPTVDFDGARTHGANPGRLGLRATIGGIYAFTDTWSGTASYGIEAESRSTAHTLNIGVSKSF